MNSEADNQETKNAGELLDALNRAGAVLLLEDGQMRLRGAKIDDGLKARLKLNRPAVIIEWQRRQEASRDRYCTVPDSAAAMAGRELSLTRPQRESVLAYVLRQPRPVHAWVMSRAAAYHALGVPLGEDEQSACVDVLAWQRNTSGQAALQWLEGLAEAAEDSGRAASTEAMP